MSTTYYFDWHKKLDVPGRVTFLEGNGGLPKMEITTALATAEIYLQGAHVTHFQKKNEEPLLFLSQVSNFEVGQPVRGGIPVVYPWFGARDGQSSHGYARNHPWGLREISTLPSGGVRVQLQLEDCPEAALYPAAKVQYSVTLGETLTLELTVTNCSDGEPLVFENCLHTYFRVGDISKVVLGGLGGAEYLDKVDNFAVRTQEGAELRISEETDRVYLDAPETVEIIDPSLGRKIRVEKSGGLSTVVWNPWIDKSARLPDFGNEEYRRMICVESGNVGRNQVSLPPGQSSALKVKLICNPL